MSTRTDVNKIIILSECELWWSDTLKTVAIHMDGMKTESILYLNDINSIHDEEELQSELMSELYDDCYDEDDIEIVCKEVYNGKHAMLELADYIYDNWSSETMILFYTPKEDAFNELKEKLNERDGDMYLMEYHELLKDKYDTERNIYDIMKFMGIKVENMIKDSYISKGYFLGALVDRFYSR